jgi:hypothetical protein
LYSRLRHGCAFPPIHLFHDRYDQVSSRSTVRRSRDDTKMSAKLP